MTTSVPYPSKPYSQTHPDRLAVVARLFGLTTADVSSCRMLEAGCGDGLNLIAMASVLPGAEFVGIDLSESAIARGVALARQAGIKNVTLIAADLGDPQATVGEFDYVVAHGVYSWVPAPVRDRLLDLCARTLTKDGTAMISYAVYPGGFVEQLVRAPMLFRASQVDGEIEKVEAVRKFFPSVIAHAPSDALRAIFEDEWRKIAGNDDGFLLHDQLSDGYHPVYFADFIRHAITHGLQYLGEAELGDLPPTGTARLDAEQQFDMLQCRRFRQTILCRSSASILTEPDPSQLNGCFVAAPPYLGGDTSLPPLEAAWPGFVPCDTLPSNDALLRLFAAGKIDLRTAPPPLDGGGSARPRATALARVQAASDQPVTNLLHHQVNIEDRFTRTLLAMLDGRRTRRELIAEIAKSQENVAQELDRILTMLGNHALLRAT
jgi:SAM-dependent methyltransferase